MPHDYSKTIAARIFSETGLTPSEITRFFACILHENLEGCKKWSGHKDKRGYGIFQVFRWGKWRRLRAHRVKYFLKHGRIDPNLTIDHTCRERDCETDEHHVEKTRGANILATPFSMASINLAKDECDYGHAFTSENTRIGTKGKRVCLTCARDYSREYMRKRNNVDPEKQRGTYKRKEKV